VLPLDDTPFFLNFPQILTTSVTGPIFTVSVPLATLPGLYPGTFSILGGASAAAFDVVGTQRSRWMFERPRSRRRDLCCCWPLSWGGAYGGLD
jgi:hypothetical protein